MSEPTERPTFGDVPGLGDLPELRNLLTTPRGTDVLHFDSSGEPALDWWRRLRDAHEATGYWPVLMDPDTPNYLDLAYKYASPADSLEQVDALNGAAILAARGEDLLSVYGPELASEVRTELRGEGPWPETAPQPGFELPFSRSGPASVIVALVPAVAGWQVPAVLHYDAGNEYPAPAEHAAILRHWSDLYQAELVALTGTTAEFSVGRPPLSNEAALALAWEYRAYNDGEYDLYQAESLTGLAASLLGATTWLAWWD